MPLSVSFARAPWFRLLAGRDKPRNRWLPASCISRYLMVLGVTVVGYPMTCAAAWDAVSPWHPPRLDLFIFNRWRAEMTPWPAVSRPVSNRTGLNPRPDFDPPSDRIRPPGMALSPAEMHVNRIAAQNGDREFLMVDKSRGRIMLFANGRPIFAGAALTGESMADQIPWDGWSKPWSEQNGVMYKVTPAGRFTITRDRDRKLGDLFDVNGLRGKGWAIAIHQVWLGNRSEHRDDRLRSPADEDKHITAGCVDVARSTMVQLWRLLPNRALPLYILPMDERLITRVFQPGGAVARLSTPTS